MKLEFISPMILNTLKQGEFANKTTWTYYDNPNSELIIDVDKWQIICLSNGKCGGFSDWVVNEYKCQFALKKDIHGDGFIDIEFPFALAMLGQLFNRTELIAYLSSLQKIFAIKQESKDYQNNLK